MSSSWISGSTRVDLRQIGQARDQEIDALREQPRRLAAPDAALPVHVASVSEVRDDTL